MRAIMTPSRSTNSSGFCTMYRTMTRVALCWIVLCLFVPCARGGQSIGSVTNPNNNHAYHLIAGNDPAAGITWTEAESTALALGGHLVTINDAAENSWIASQFSQSYLWIGLNDATVEGSYQWTSGAPVTYTNWASGEPNNFGGNEDYGQMYNFAGAGYRWNDNSNFAGYVGQPFYGIAEIPQSTPISIGAGVLQYGDRDVLGTGNYATDPTVGATLKGLAPGATTFASAITQHSFPFVPSATDHPGTDRIYSAPGQGSGGDGYSSSASRVSGPQTIQLDYSSLVRYNHKVDSLTVGIAA